jgi:hypothetical protein
MKRIAFAIIISLLPTVLWSQKSFVFTKGKVKAWVAPNEADVTRTAFDLFSKDAMRVCECQIEKTSSHEAEIIVTTLDNSAGRKVLNKLNINTECIAVRHEAFLIVNKSTDNGQKLVIVGNDKRGTAYGLMTLSAELGVSAWEWWADCEPTKRVSVTLEANYMRHEAPDVEYRGIFLNDEDWGLCPWSSLNYEPSVRKAKGEDVTPRKGEIGPYTHEKIFELLLRLKANTFWPAMHECSTPFYFVEGNKEMADKYGIVVSTSHCEPMMRNTNGEWKTAGKGDYNFVNNAESVTTFWEERVKELSGSDCIFTLGMRGVHDSGMRGAKTVDEQTAVLKEVISTQRDILKKHHSESIEAIPQQFIPYKEVLDCYNNGLDVPDDVTLIWCDDNYGYIRHFPTEAERQRVGGHGMYYHISYWGRPHDYLWLSTTHPQLIKEEMLRAYDNGVKKIWILNVGDIKPMEHNISLFMDMAWNIERFRTSTLYDYSFAWYKKLFGETAALLMPLWQIYYDESFRMRPEFLGGTRTEEKDPKYKKIADVALSSEECLSRIIKAEGIIATLNTIKPDTNSDAWFELVEYPLKSFAYMNMKMLGAQLARHGLWQWEKTFAAQDSIKALTKRYNELNNGKWDKMMDYRPRRLPVFDDIERRIDTKDPQRQAEVTLFKSVDAIGTQISKEHPLLIPINDQADSVTLIIELLPVHPTDNNAVCFYIGRQGEEPVKVEYQTKGRSEEWKQNVLYNKAVREITITRHNKNAPFNVVLTADDEGVYVQTIKRK